MMTTTRTGLVKGVLLPVIVICGLPLSNGCITCLRKSATATPIMKTEKPITVDGAMDEVAWAAATPVEVNYELRQVGQRATDHRMTARFLWDDRYLYIGYKVSDSHIVALDDGRTKGPPKNRRKAALAWAPEKKNDCAEFFVSLGDMRFMWEIQHNASNHLNDVFLNVLDPEWPIASSTLSLLGVILNEEQYIKDSGPATVKTAIRLLPGKDGKPSTINNPDDIDTGYTGEMRFPWVGMGPPKSAMSSAKQKKMPAGSCDMGGREIMILGVILNGNNGAVYHHSSPTMPNKGMFASSAAHFPRYILTTE